MRMTAIMGSSPRPGKRTAWPIALAMAVALPVAAGQWALASSAFMASDFTVMPLEGSVSSKFGDIRKIGQSKTHRGIDIKAPLGADIVAPAAGRVVQVMKSDEGYGNRITLDHGNGYKTVYAHLGQMMVDGDVRVSAGQKIAEVGMTGLSTGPHLHLEVYYNGELVDPLTVMPNGN